MASSSTPVAEEEEPPLSPPPFPVGARVTVHDLQSKPEWNGRSGNVLCFYRTGVHAGRCGVQLDGGDLPTAALKPENLSDEVDFRPWPPETKAETNKFFDDVYKLRDQGKMECFREELSNAICNGAWHGKDAQCQYIFAKEALSMDDLDSGIITTSALMLEMAADQGHVPATYMLGTVKDSGYGDDSKSDERGAHKLFRRAAKFDYAKAIGALANAFERDRYRRGSSDNAAANEHYERAARLGDPRSAFNLGCSYRDGDGMTPDRTKALRWFRYAASMDYDDAVRSLRALERDVNYVPGSVGAPDFDEPTLPHPVSLEDGMPETIHELAQYANRYSGMP